MTRKRRTSFATPTTRRCGPRSGSTSTRRRWCGAATRARWSSGATVWWRRSSGTARRGRGIRSCTPTWSSPTWRTTRAMGGGRRCSPGLGSTGGRARSGTCIRRSCGGSSPARWASTGGRSPTGRRRSAGSPGTSCGRSRTGGSRSKPTSKPTARPRPAPRSWRPTPPARPKTRTQPPTTSTTPGGPAPKTVGLDRPDDGGDPRPAGGASWRRRSIRSPPTGSTTTSPAPKG